ncbi:MAG: hypothetical protein ACE5IL_11040, partial [Myxococcota bacterium]
MSADSGADRDLALWHGVPSEDSETHGTRLRSAPALAPIGTRLAKIVAAEDGRVLAASVMQKDVISVSPELPL